MAGLLRGRCTSPHAHEEPLPLVLPHPGWRHACGAKHYAHHYGHAPPRQRRSWRRLTQRVLLAALAVLVALRIGTHMLSSSEPDLEDLMRLYGDGLGAAMAQQQQHPPLLGGAAGAAGAEAPQPKLIPRIIHQAHGPGALPPQLLPYLASWRRLNLGWEVRLYDDQECLEFVRREFPDYLEAYRRLGSSQERIDFFSYMVVLRHGGVYAAPEAECRRPLDGLLRSGDTLVAGWDTEFAEAHAALEAGNVRLRQLVHWVFAGAPGHPALRELCDRTAAAARDRATFSSDARLDAAERTGAGLFTDVMLRHAAQHPPAARQDPWGVRLLPRVTFGAPQQPAYGLSASDPGVAVLRHTLGGSGDHASSSGGGGSWPWAVAQGAASEVARRWRHRSEDAWGEAARRMQAADAARRLYPVSVDFEPPFDLLTHRLGRGERQSGADVGSAVTTHGAWQPSVQPSRRPSLLEAIVGSMGGADARQHVLIDVGAGYGLLTLAAAARGHRVHAFELGPASLEALEASLQHNGFEHLVQVHKEPLGSPEQAGYTCVLPRQAGSSSSSSSGSSSSSSSSSSSGRAPVDLEVQRGYGPAEVHASPADACQLMVRRAAGAATIPDSDRIAALRVSANGWEGHVLRGFAPMLQRPDRRPPVVAVEWNPAAMRAAGWRKPLQLVEWLHGLGYSDISHSGYVCDERWYAITYGVRRRGGITPEDLAGLRQPTWCRLLPQHFRLLLDRASGSPYPETLLFVSRGGNATAGGSPAPGGEQQPGSGGGGGGAGGGGVDEYGVPDAVSQALAEARLMVADAAANHTAAAVQQLAAPGGNAGEKGGAAGAAAGTAQDASEQQQQQQQQQRTGRPLQAQPVEGQ